MWESTCERELSKAPRLYIRAETWCVAQIQIVMSVLCRHEGREIERLIIIAWALCKIIVRT